MDALVFALYVPASLDPAAGLGARQGALRASEKALIPGQLVQVAAADDLESAARRGEVAVLFGLENGRPLTVPGALDDCAKMGVRYVTLTHWASHEWCDASTDSPVHGGLSREGEAIVRRMNRLGILPDVSHVSDDAVLHTLDVSTAPVIASHSSARALCDHPRNLPDPLIREIARKDGVVMANSYPAFVAPRPPRRTPTAARSSSPSCKRPKRSTSATPAGSGRSAPASSPTTPSPRSPSPSTWTTSST